MSGGFFTVPCTRMFASAVYIFSMSNPHNPDRQILILDRIYNTIFSMAQPIAFKPSQVLTSKRAWRFR
jgi:hypothetical protein